jgi:hypothetical protein
MARYTEPPHALLERRRNVGQEILEFPVVQLTLSQRTLRRKPTRKIFSMRIQN